jgi:hypothetical protein
MTRPGPMATAPPAPDCPHPAATPTTHAKPSSAAPRPAPRAGTPRPRWIATNQTNPARNNTDAT